MDITIERSLDLSIIQRQGYTTFDLISDIGGMQSILVCFTAFVLSVLNYNIAENYLV